MKVALLSTFFLLNFITFVQCYKGIEFDPLQNLLDSMREKRSMNIDSEYDTNNEEEYEAVYIGTQDELKEVDKIVTLPGQPEVFFYQYSGYVTIDPNDEKALFYYFVESHNSSTTKPLLLWLNGGPGCSSFGDGAMMELGPFRVNPDGKTLWLNKYAWNNVANLLFLESPAGVGFSYSNKSTDYIFGDKQTATDSYTFLVNWLERFPEYKERDFFIAGESYAGHFVPQLAQLILQNNKITNQTSINLKGIAIGNAYIDYESLDTGIYDYLWSHALISDETHQGIVLNCNFSSTDSPLSDACDEYISQSRKEKGNFYNFDIYAPLCGVPSNSPPDSVFDPCTENYIASYLNMPEVQKSLHVNVTGQLPGTWKSCNYDITQLWKDKPHTVLPTIKDLMSTGIRVWLYRVDFDPLEDLLASIRERRSTNIGSEYDTNDEAGYGRVYVGPQDGLKEVDRIMALPGQPEVVFDQYSGYVTIDPDDEKSLFYYFVESGNSSSTNPLVLWLNGGPGCSSFGDGAMMELGPFRVNPDGKTLWLNKYAWNNVANIIFLESPAGVGFSYSNKSTDYIFGDKQAAADSYTFLVNWLERFPEYKERDFFIAGESYTGHYAPQLAQLILQNNKITNQTVINLKGIAGIYWNCNFSSSDSPSSDACNEYLSQVRKAKGNIFNYDLYAPLCDVTSKSSPHDSGFDPCWDKYVSSYLNTPEVQKALHVNVTGQLPGTWQVCNYDMLQLWKDEPDTVLPTIKDVMSAGIRVWLYSGDTDLQVPVTSTQDAIKKLGVSVKTPWQHWNFQGEVGGYVEEYQNLTFATVRGAGHFVPSYQPSRALDLYSSFLNGGFPLQ